MLMLIALCAINVYSQSAEQWIEIAKIAEQEGRWTEAGAARSSAGHVQRENGDYAAAAQNFERAANHFENDKRDAQADAEHSWAAVSHEQAAEKAAKEGRKKEAAGHYEEAAKQWEKMGHTHMAEHARAMAQSLPDSHQSGVQNEFGEEVTHALESAKKLDENAWKKYESAYLEKTPAEQAKAFEEAAAMFDEAAKAYRNEGNEARAKVMDGNARAARSNAENRRKGQQDTRQSSSNTSTQHSSRFSVSLSGLMPLGDIAPQQVQRQDLETVFHAPGIFEQIMERLGGEFSIGDLSGHTTQNFGMRGTTKAMPGLRLGYRLGNRLELRAGGHYFQTKWSGNFPVVVFPNEQNPSMPPQTLQGTLAASSSGILAETDLAYFFTAGTIRPFVNAGIRGQFPTQNESGATLAGVAMPLETTPLGSSYSPFGGAGLRVEFLKNGFLDANASYAKMPGGGYAPSASLNAGWRFGTVHKPKNPGEPIPLGDVNCNVCLEDGKCDCGDISFDLLVTHYSLKIQNDGKKNVREYNVKQPVKTAVKEDSQSGVGKDKAQAPAEIKPAMPGLKAGDEAAISLTNINIDCPCTNGTSCESYKPELPNTKEGKASLAKIAKAIAADAALGKANEELAKIEEDLGAAKSEVAKKNAKNKLQKAKDKVVKLEKELKEAQEALATDGLGNPNIKVGGKDASGSWDTTTGVFTFDKNGDYGLKVDKVPFVFEFEVSFKCQSFKCDGVTCTRKFKLTL